MEKKNTIVDWRYVVDQNGGQKQYHYTCCTRWFKYSLFRSLAPVCFRILCLHGSYCFSLCSFLKLVCIHAHRIYISNSLAFFLSRFRKYQKTYEYCCAPQTQFAYTDLSTAFPLNSVWKNCVVFIHVELCFSLAHSSCFKYICLYTYFLLLPMNYDIHAT